MRFTALDEDNWAAAADAYHASLESGQSRSKAFRKAHDVVCKAARKASERARAAPVSQEVRAVIDELAKLLGRESWPVLREKMSRPGRGAPEVAAARDEISYALAETFVDQRTIGAAFRRDRSTIAAAVKRHRLRMRDDALAASRMAAWLETRGRKSVVS